MSALKQSAYYGVGIIMMKGVSLFMMPYVTSRLTPYEYGSLESLILLTDIGTIIIGFGIIESLYRYVGPSDGRKRSELISNCFLLSLLVAIAASFLIWLMLPLLLANLPHEFAPYQIVLITVPTLLEGLIAIPLTLMRMEALAKKFCLYNVVKAIFQALLIIILLEAGYGIDALLIAGACSSVMLLFFLLKFQWTQMAGSVNLGYSLPLLKYSVPFVISNIGLFAITGLDRWVLADKVGVDTLAVYAIAAKFAMICALLMQPFALWWYPNRIKILQQEQGRELCARNAILGTNLGIFFAVSLILTVPSFICLFLPEDYHLAAKVVVGLILVSALKNASDLLNLGCFSGDSSQCQMWIQWLCSALAVTGYWLLIPQYNIWAAVFVLAGVYTVRLALFYYFSQTKLTLPYRHSDWLACVLIGAALYGISQVIYPALNLWAQLIVGGLLSLSMLVLLISIKVFPSITPSRLNLTAS
ncbi:lipopolysaccharide biosynthesis protein [Photobacterium alginatilyticum]|uniref:Lipopolysaccharide biosynthesis protein n=1 Tax=Photobacterium alginatilyticum TaxID=1775171 RepID=A0ABW9YNI6_9GAMM|nr:oligosaccharide flippase family protein [Photobacterium alginatilyticum]NBI54768.1 lipopolysaccharide biosynthesis protein [Photobacterium alginatilyticum]